MQEIRTSIFFKVVIFAVMKKIQVLIVTIFLSGLSFAQDDLEDAFDDGRGSSELGIFLSSDLVTTLCGSPNVMVEGRFYQKVGFQVGVGLVPFRYLAEFSEFLDAPTDELLLQGIRKGGFLEFSGKYFFLGNSTYDFYAGMTIKSWRYTPGATGGDDLLRGHKRRYLISIGYLFQPHPKIGFDITAGGGYNRSFMKGSNEVKTSNQLGIGLDLGFSITYQIN